MAQQQRYLGVRQGECLGGQVLLVRALTENAEILEPLGNPKWGPAIAGAADQQLVPVTHSVVARDAAAKHFGCAANRSTVFLGRGGVAQRLVVRIASIADQMRQQHYPVIRPAFRLNGFRYPAREREPITHLEGTDAGPVGRGQKSVVGRAADRSTARELNLEYGAATDPPHLVGPGPGQSLVCIDGPDLRLRLHEVRNRYASSVGQAHECVPGDALTQIGHDRLLVLALLHRTIKL